MKKPFILLGGFSKTGTTSLYKCLKPILTTGICKEHGYLSCVQDFKSQIAYFNSRNYAYKISSVNSLYDKWDSLSQLKRDFFTTQSPSINQYLDYYLEISRDCPDKTLIGDFTASNLNINVSILSELKEKFDPYFNVKVLLSLRDPVERLFSEFKYSYDKKIKYKSNEKIVLEKLINEYSGLYSKIYKKYSQIFPTFCLDSIKFINEKYKKGEFETFFDISIPDFNPVKENASKDIIIPSYYYTIAKRILKPDIDFYQSHL